MYMDILYIHIYMHIYIRIYTHVDICIHKCLHIYIHTCKCISTHTYTHTHTRIHIYIYIYTYIYVYIHTPTYIYLCVHHFTHSLLFFYLKPYQLFPVFYPGHQKGTSMCSLSQTRPFFIRIQERQSGVCMRTNPFHENVFPLSKKHFFTFS